jgi:hypothetical protein
MEQEGANDIVCGVDNAFSFTILWRGVGTRHAQVHAVGEEERVGPVIIEFADVIPLDPLDVDTELGANISKKKLERVEKVFLSHSRNIRRECEQSSRITK